MDDRTTMDYVFRDWHRKDPRAARITRTWMDPCPECSEPVASVHGETTYIIDNPTAVIGYRNPSCEWDPDDPDSPDCICGPAIVNPCPDPLYNERRPLYTVYTFQPCGHKTTGKIHIYQETKAEPGTLGELMALWSNDDDARDRWMVHAVITDEAIEGSADKRWVAEWLKRKTGSVPPPLQEFLPPDPPIVYEWRHW